MPRRALTSLQVLIPFAVISSACIHSTYFAMFRRFYNLRQVQSPSQNLSRRTERCLLTPLNRGKSWSKHETVWSTITLGLSDIQLASSFAYSASATYLLHARDLTAYHYNVICYLGIAATFTSVATMFSPPLYIQKKWISGARITLFSFSVGFLGYLLVRRFEKRDIFPVRAPSSAAGKKSALVLQTSCLILKDRRIANLAQIVALYT